MQPDRTIETDILEGIATHGWFTIIVSADDEGPGFAYTVGLFKSFSHPEVIVFGLPDDVMERLLATVAALVKGGSKMEDGAYSDEVLDGFSCAFRRVRPENYDDHLGFAVWYYETQRASGFPVLQCLWPDKARRFPWDPECHEVIRDLQPGLY